MNLIKSIKNHLPFTTSVANNHVIIGGKFTIFYEKGY